MNTLFAFDFKLYYIIMLSIYIYRYVLKIINKRNSLQREKENKFVKLGYLQCRVIERKMS